jgi:DNA-binding protein H-NS
MMGYGRTDAVDGSVFPYAFPLVTTYQMQASAIVKFIKEKLGGEPGRQEDRLSVSRLRLWQGGHHRTWTGRGRV